MPSYFKVDRIPWGVLILLVISIACIAGLLNGLYNLGGLAEETGDISAELVVSKAKRASLYGYFALSTSVLALIFSIQNRIKPDGGK